MREFFPAAREIKYTPEIKTAMMLKAKGTIGRGCLEYDTSYTDITAAFMAIRKTMTASGARSTYTASRSEEASHADVAWAIMYTLFNKPLTAGSGHSSRTFWSFADEQAQRPQGIYPPGASPGSRAEAGF